MQLSEGRGVPMAVVGGIFLNKNAKVYTDRGLSLQQRLLCWYGLKFCPLKPSVLVGTKGPNQSVSLWECISWGLLGICNRNCWPLEPEQELLGSMGSS